MNLTDSNITFILSAYGPPGPLNYGVFLLMLALYLATVFSNLTLMLVISSDSSLHKPMYIFLFNLAINGLMGSSAVCPAIMQYLLVGLKTISFKNCLMQMFFINVYGSCAYAILTVMAYDRYVCICKPLQYHTIMTPTKVRLLLSVVYIFPVCLFTVQVCLTSRLPMCKYTMYKLFCDNLTLVSLACVKTALDNLFGLWLFFLFAVLPLLSVVLSYIKILTVSFKASGNAQAKALKTCAPHLITFINFSSAILFSVVYHRFNDYVTNEINALMSVHYILIPPLLHPLIYGMKTHEIKKSFTKILRKNIFAINLSFGRPNNMVFSFLLVKT
ncbi:olfactory receptor 52E4-like [Chanos chanos]|uniref:Olfactory receptor n=1 Tax=Chanos chanos TaxID=29144 RepID=A0A6J2VP32_CHACN|nr:olfactory receptor 52E4-like [Chanos chanos]